MIQLRRIDVKKINFKLDPNKPDQIALDSDAEVHFNVPRFAKMMKPTIESLSLEGRVSDQGGNFICSNCDTKSSRGILFIQSKLFEY